MDEKDTFEINSSCSMESNRVDNSLLEQWIILLGKERNLRREVKGLAADSSGLNSRNVKLVCDAY